MTLFSSIHNPELPNLRGEYGENLAIVFFVQHGYRVAASNGDHYPYDLIVERHGKMHRIQVKTTRSKTGNYYRSKFSVSDEFDAALIINEIGEVYLIPRTDMTFENPSSRAGRGSDTRRFVLYPKYRDFLVGEFQGFTSSGKGSDGVVELIESILTREKVTENEPND